MKKNPPKGSLRKEMTDAEKEWEKNFNLVSGEVIDEFTGEIRKVRQMDLKALAKIVPNPKVFPEVMRKVVTENDALSRDIYNNMRPLHGHYEDEEGEPIHHDIGLESIIYDTPREDVEDETLNPKIKVNRYTVEDYCPPSFPDEDALIVAIDHDRAQAEKKKITSFNKFRKQEQKRKKYDPAG